jgi:large subunit ribosomal protein L15
MEILSNLSKVTQKSARRRGRGIGSGMGGHTTGRGSKGDKARGKVKLTFDGTKIKKGWIKRLPFLRGKNRLSNQKNVVTFNLSQLDKWYQAGDMVDTNSLAQKTHIPLKRLNASVKILSFGEITKKITLKGVLVSKVAHKKIITAGGNIE